MQKVLSGTTQKSIFINMQTVNSVEEFANRTGIKSSSTILSGIKRLIEKGYLINNINSYKIEDPYFKLWVNNFVQQ